jgi:hypothetical protein
MNDIIVNIIKMFLTVASPEIVKMIRKSVQDMVDKARETDNPWDDIFAELLQLIVGKP